jgi:hypothetical protein
LIALQYHYTYPQTEQRTSADKVTFAGPLAWQKIRDSHLAKTIAAKLT